MLKGRFAFNVQRMDSGNIEAATRSVAVLIQAIACEFKFGGDLVGK